MVYVKSIKGILTQEETPPTNHVEEDGREEVKLNTKLQPTSEQLRLAQITQGTGTSVPFSFKLILFLL
jgi:hypothetical protein